jgi:hypothetical protein
MVETLTNQQMMLLQQVGVMLQITQTLINKKK